MAGGPGGAAPARGRFVLNRREFLSTLGLAAAALAGVEGLIVRPTFSQVQAGAAARSLFDRIKGLPPEVTPTDKFFVISKNPPGRDPRVGIEGWTLEIVGLVGRPIRLTYEQVRAMPHVVRYHTLECISNNVGGDLIGNALWRGVRFRDLIASAGGVGPGAVRFALRCADGYTEGLPVAEAMHPDAMLAYEMNGQRLSPSHGFPVRLLVPGLYGMKNTKWLTKIEAVPTQFAGYWQASGWSDEAVVKTTSMFRLPGQRPVRVGEVELGGVAYAGDRGIAEVQVSTDEGRTWARAEVKKPLGPHTWVLWGALWVPSRPGEYALRVRARDGGGVMQTAAEAPPAPDGASGYHAVRARVIP
ncbi:MAG: molybdopterin-binding oxidoreductase [Armatimonadetes bacterium]|nr:molybdopterin-binding oxidoreductase [Armatimonadota bacterium]